MLCYPCAEQGVQQTAVALCRSCSAGLCMDHLRETASHFKSAGRVEPQCHHDTWHPTQRPSGASGEPQ
jgi:hypothetical protein